jgi:hypothetical protein
VFITRMACNDRRAMIPSRHLILVVPPCHEVACPQSDKEGGPVHGDPPVEPLPDFKFADKTAKPSERRESRTIAAHGAGSRLRAGGAASVR